VSPTPLTAWTLGAVALAALVLPPVVVAAVAFAVVVAALVDANAARRRLEVTRSAPALLARGVPAPLSLRVDHQTSGRGRVRVRQPVPPDLALDPSEAQGGLEAALVARRRGRHTLAAAALRIDGPLGLGCCYRRAGTDHEILVYPDLPAARRLAVALRQGRFGDPGQANRGPLGLGTDFESIRDYAPDDDIRQVNWVATARTGRAMSNQYRVERDRDVLVVVDSGRLMGAPLGELTRLDAAVDACAAVALAADELGDRCGCVAFDQRVLRKMTPRRKGSGALVKTLFDLEPSDLDSDYELAFRTVGGNKRALVFVFTDLLDEAAARSLLGAAPWLARRHVVQIVSATDAGLDDLLAASPLAPEDVYASGVALDMLEARARVARRLRRAGAGVLEAPPERLGGACVRAYLRAKLTARL